MRQQVSLWAFLANWLWRVDDEEEDQDQELEDEERIPELLPELVIDPSFFEVSTDTDLRSVKDLWRGHQSFIIRGQKKRVQRISCFAYSSIVDSLIYWLID